MNLKYIFLKEKVINSVREFFNSRGFHEVITPVFNRSVSLEPNLYPFSTVWQVNNCRFYLSLSPEKCLKRMLALGMGNCYSIGHTFRNLEGSGIWHSPEFLMLEWYRENSDYKKIMEETREFILFTYEKIKNQKSKIKNKNKNSKIKLWQEFSLLDLFKNHSNLDLEKLCYGEIPRRVRDDYDLKGASWEQMFNQIFLNEIELKLPKEPLFITDFPSRISPLCAPRKDRPYLAERFEVYISGIEIGNGNTENTDYKSVLKIFTEERKRRIESQKKGHPFDMAVQPVDMEFINSLKMMKKSGKSYAGIGLGVDRLVKLLT